MNVTFPEAKENVELTPFSKQTIMQASLYESQKHHGAPGEESVPKQKTLQLDHQCA